MSLRQLLRASSKGLLAPSMSALRTWFLVFVMGMAGGVWPLDSHAAAEEGGESEAEAAKPAPPIDEKGTLTGDLWVAFPTLTIKLRIPAGYRVRRAFQRFEFNAPESAAWFKVLQPPSKPRSFGGIPDEERRGFTIDKRMGERTYGPLTGQLYLYTRDGKSDKGGMAVFASQVRYQWALFIGVWQREDRKREIQGILGSIRPLDQGEGPAYTLEEITAHLTLR